jgi:hypothetical protein
MGMGGEKFYWMADVLGFNREWIWRLCDVSVVNLPEDVPGEVVSRDPSFNYTLERALQLRNITGNLRHCS